MSIAEPTTAPVVYPSGDGQPMAETGLHVQAIVWLHQALEDYFRSRSGPVYLASDQFWYWREGDPTCRVAPDVMVVPGVAARPRRSFFSWEEGGAVPAVVFEMASQGTWRDDLDDKYDQYEALGVREYFVFDPEGLSLVPPVQGYRLSGTAYRRIRQDQLTSELGFGMRAEGTMLRLVDLATGQPIPTRAEAVDAAQQQVEAEKQRAEAEKQRGDTLQAEVERLRARLHQLGHLNGSDG